MRVRKAVVPVAGFGTRFLPATRSVPKVMFPILDTPQIHYAVKEAVDAGIDQIAFVVSRGQEAACAYFDRAPDLEEALGRRGEEARLKQMVEIAQMADIRSIRQERLLGLGDAVFTAREFVGAEPFAVFLPDDVIWADRPTIAAMVDTFRQRGGPVIAVREVPDHMVPSLGIIEPETVADDTYRVLSLVEKPSVADASSNLAIVGRYVLTPDIFDALEETRPGAIGEVQITDAIAGLLPTQAVYAYRFPGVHFDVGTPAGLLKASVHAALRREDLADDLRRWLKEQLETPTG